MSDERRFIWVCDECGHWHGASYNTWPADRPPTCKIKGYGRDGKRSCGAVMRHVELVPASRLAEVEQHAERLRQEKGLALEYLGEYGAGGAPAGLVPAIHNLAARTERAEVDRDRAVETRENANAVSVRVEIEARQLRERAERAEAALREIGPELANFACYARSVADDSTGMRRKMWQERAAWGERLAALASVPSSLDAPKPTWDPPMGQRPTSGNPAVVDAPKEQP